MTEVASVQTTTGESEEIVMRVFTWAQLSFHISNDFLSKIMEQKESFRVGY